MSSHLGMPLCEDGTTSRMLIGQHNYAIDIDKCIANITPASENYYMFVNLVRRIHHKNIPRCCRTRYIYGRNDHTKEMYEDYLIRFTEDLFSEDTVKLGDVLLNEISESQCRK